MGCYNDYDGYGCRDRRHGYYRDRYDEYGPRGSYGPRGPFGPCGPRPCHDRRPYPPRGIFFGFPRLF